MGGARSLLILTMHFLSESTLSRSGCDQRRNFHPNLFVVRFYHAEYHDSGLSRLKLLDPCSTSTRNARRTRQPGETVFQGQHRRMQKKEHLSFCSGTSQAADCKLQPDRSDVSKAGNTPQFAVLLPRNAKVAHSIQNLPPALRCTQLPFRASVEAAYGTQPC